MGNAFSACSPSGAAQAEGEALNYAAWGADSILFIYPSFSFPRRHYTVHLYTHYALPTCRFLQSVLTAGLLV